MPLTVGEARSINEAREKVERAEGVAANINLHELSRDEAAVIVRHALRKHPLTSVGDLRMAVSREGVFVMGDTLFGRLVREIKADMGIESVNGYPGQKRNDQRWRSA